MVLLEYVWNALPLPQVLFLLLLFCITRILQVGRQSQLRSPLVLFCSTVSIVTVNIIAATTITIVIINTDIAVRNHVGSNLYRQPTPDRLAFLFCLQTFFPYHVVLAEGNCRKSKGCKCDKHLL